MRFQQLVENKILVLLISIISVFNIQESRAVEPEKPRFYYKSPKEGLKEALIYYKIQHPEIVYAQAQLETGNFTSILCTKYNNIFGLYNSKKKRYYRFNHWVESVEAYRDKIQYRYKPPEDYYEFLKRIHYARSPKYVSKLKQIIRQNGKAK